MSQRDIPTDAALFVSAFFDELIRCGVRDVVISPGSRSTPLAMVAYASKLRVYVDIDERGAAFFALGLAKASGCPVCAVCTSGTAVANYYPAVLEAEASRVPLIFLTGDRPPLMQNLGAPQTCDQLKAFGDHVRLFQQMPLPGGMPSEIAFARQMAIAAFSAAVGTHASVDDAGNPFYGCISNAGPVHMNFPFEEPLKPNLESEGLFSCGRRSLATAEGGKAISPVTTATAYPGPEELAGVLDLVGQKRTLVLCGEGSCVNRVEAELLLAWARQHELPLLADPLSNLRSFDDPLVIDNYDNLFGTEKCPAIELVIRFGRYPISKPCFTALNAMRPTQVVVDTWQTRDFNATTDLFIRCTPAAFVASCLHEVEGKAVVSDGQRDFAQQWVERNGREAGRIRKVSEIGSGFEGAFIYRLFSLAPEGSCVFLSSSTTIRMADTFYLKADKKLTLFCNRGLNGIDGTLSSAVGAAQCFEATTFVTGDLAFLHDLNALALQRELMTACRQEPIPSIVVVLVNNNCGGLFDLLPQRSDEDYFNRLFLTPQDVGFSAVAQAFNIPYASVQTVDAFEAAYQQFLGKPGMHIIDLAVPSTGLKERYGHFLS